IFTLAFSFATSAAGAVHVLIAKQVRPICLAMHHVFDLCAAHRFAEVVFGFDGGANGVALEDALLVGRYPYLVFGFLVFLHAEAAAHAVTASGLAAHGDGVITERGIGAEGEVSVDTAELRDGGLGVIDLAAVGIFDADFYGL